MDDFFVNPFLSDWELDLGVDGDDDAFNDEHWVDILTDNAAINTAPR